MAPGQMTTCFMPENYFKLLYYGKQREAVSISQRKTWDKINND